MTNNKVTNVIFREEKAKNYKIKLKKRLTNLNFFALKLKYENTGGWRGKMNKISMVLFLY